MSLPPLVLTGDCRALLPHVPDASVDAIVTDPPYELGFMGKTWDASGIAYDVEVWREALRVLKPGGHLAAFGGTRTYHRMACAIEDAGFEIRDSLHWITGSGFPKSFNVSKDQRFCRCATGPAVPYVHGDSHVHGVREDLRDACRVAEAGEGPNVFASVQREGARASLGATRSQGPRGVDGPEQDVVPTEDVRRAQPRLEGRGDVQTPEGQLRRPSVRPLSGGPHDDGPIGRVRDGAPASDGAVDRAAIDAHGVCQPHRSQPAEQRPIEPGAVPDESGSQAGRGWPLCPGCGKPRVTGVGTALKPAHEPIVLARKPLQGTVAANVLQHGVGGLNVDGCRVATTDDLNGGAYTKGRSPRAMNPDGAGLRNVADCGTYVQPPGRWPSNVVFTHDPGCDTVCAEGCPVAELDQQSGTLTSGANPKRRGADKNRTTLGEFAGQDECDAPRGVDSGGASRFYPVFRYCAKAPTKERPKVDGKGHPTVKPLALMRWLVRLVTPPGGLVLDPFAGTGTTLQAARDEGMRAIGIELDPDHVRLIEVRLAPAASSTEAAS